MQILFRDSDFEPEVRARGLRYCQEGRVTLLDATPEYLSAQVRGKKLYDVEIDVFGKGNWDGMCTCPYNEDNDVPCKHIYATLLKAREEGVLAASANWKSSTQRTMPAKEMLPKWKRHLQRVRQQMEDYRWAATQLVPETWPADSTLLYIVDVLQMRADPLDGLKIEVATERHKSGKPQGSRRIKMSEAQWLAAPDEADRLIAMMLLGTDPYDYYPRDRADWRYVLPPHSYGTTLKMMCQTGRCRLRAKPGDKALIPLAWDDSPPWTFALNLVPVEGRHCRLEGWLRRGDERMDLHEPELVLEGGILIARHKVSMLNHFGAWALLVAMRDVLEWVPPAGDVMEVLKELSSLPAAPPIDVPPALCVQQITQPPRPHLMLRRQTVGHANAKRVNAKVGFSYGEHEADLKRLERLIFDRDAGRLIYRDLEAESARLEELRDAGFRQESSYASLRSDWLLPVDKLGPAVLDLTNRGWHVEAEGKLYRRPGEFKIEVSSGIDWFDLSAEFNFGDQRASLPKLLEALERGEKMVVLDDGTMGILPEEWLQKYTVLGGMGEEVEGKLRFQKTQVGLLDALLASIPEATCDETFARARQELASFRGIDPAEPSPSFIGELRPYQKLGLGWLHFLRKFGFGGCLADDMGLGKTIQVLALLEERRQEKAGPSLVVVPRSLIFNWQQEASRFVPQMRVLDQSGTGRLKGTDHLPDYDLVLTTYGTLRRDAGYFRDFVFDYVILDEAQAIKNPSSESAKAARILQARQRLAMSGTPIENHLGELWSLFAFLNPGMLGRAGAFRQLGWGKTEADSGGRRIIAEAVRPFILRRTKQQVATELPEKMEQTIFCEMEPAQRKLYDELRDHYRRALLSKVEQVGMNRVKIQVLEALLRLRQAACHPALIDKTLQHDHAIGAAGVESGVSCKLEALREQLEDVLDGGYKALVFSQFTSLLKIVRQQLDERKIIYEYLDGQTRDRQQRVERFQTDPKCQLFLISLKAGGLGLNLTEANYVFLLDPWWNPAVEAQAIDRAHRIGQSRNVFAYRLIVKDTVEEKVLELQQSKRDLADAIINADNSLIAKLGREDLERLLS